MSRATFSRRRRARMLAFLVLYGLSFAPAADREELGKAFASSRDLEAVGDNEERPEVQEGGASPNESGFAWELTEGVWSGEKELNAYIQNFSRNWRLERMGRIELTLLRIALFEIKSGMTPPRVAIKEALDMAVIFGAAHAVNFINGVLDAAAQNLAGK